MLPPRIPKKSRRATRWRSPAHTKHVRSFACAMCHSTTNVVAAHFRFGSDAGTGEKPDDWLTTPLCDGPFSNIDGKTGCHRVQHAMGEQSFWRDYARRHGQTVHQLIEALIASSPKRKEIERVRKERAHAA
jgi:hypothetical protein